MDSRKANKAVEAAEAINEAVQNISRNLVLIKGEIHNHNGVAVVNDALTSISQFEKVDVHAVWKIVEANQ